MLFKSLLNKITIRKIGNKQIYILPWEKDKNEKKEKKIIKALKKIKAFEDKQVVLSDELSEFESIKSFLKNKKVKILNGRMLFKLLTNKIVNYITKVKNTELREQNIAILVNNPDEITMNNIITLAPEVKELRIITNNGIYFKRIEQKLYGEMGVPITIVNNKRKSLLKSDIILNVDFTEKEIKQYNLNKKATLININNEIVEVPKAFDGVNIKWYRVKMSDEYLDLFTEYNLYKQFDENILYESMIYNEPNKEKIIEKDKIEIEYLIGNNGKISEKEYK